MMIGLIYSLSDIDFPPVLSSNIHDTLDSNINISSRILPIHATWIKLRILSKTNIPKYLMTFYFRQNFHLCFFLANKRTHLKITLVARARHTLETLDELRFIHIKANILLFNTNNETFTWYVLLIHVPVTAVREMARIVLECLYFS